MTGQLPPPQRVVAIDWSGARDARSQRQRIWTAVVSATAVRLFAERTRDELCACLIEEFSGTATVVGFDFAFSFPAAFFAERGYAAVSDLWTAAARDGEAWLQGCPPPFWGRPGKKCPPTHGTQGFRRTDLAISVGAIRPKSPLQIGGAGAVGTGAVRGMPVLARLRDAGFSIWPFDPPRLPLAVEIYPRLFTGPLVKSSAAARAAHLNRPAYGQLPPQVLHAATGSEDAFDALLSALALWEHRSDFRALRRSPDPIEQLEGRIWSPRSR